jgi:hypothetical protein
MLEKIIEMSCDAEDSLCTGTESKMPAPEQLENRGRRTRSRPLYRTQSTSHTIKRKTGAPVRPDTPKDRTSSGRKATAAIAPLKLKFPGVIKQEDWYTMQSARL